MIKTNDRNRWEGRDWTIVLPRASSFGGENAFFCPHPPGFAIALWETITSNGAGTFNPHPAGHLIHLHPSRWRGLKPPSFNFTPVRNSEICKRLDHNKLSWSYNSNSSAQVDIEVMTGQSMCQVRLCFYLATAWVQWEPVCRHYLVPHYAEWNYVNITIPDQN